MVENLGEVLSPDDVALILKDAYVPSRRMHNPMLKEMMGEMDACWFDNVWLNIQELESRYRRALAYMHVLDVGNYVFSFTPETKHMRRPLSEVLMRLWRAQRAVVNNGQIHYAANQEANEFIRQVRADLMFVRLPRPEGLAALQHGIVGWRETWVRGTGAAWAELIAERRERLGDTVTSKAHYLELVKEFLERARHVPKWAIAHFEDGFLSVAEIGSLVRQMRRRVEATYAKDFSDVLGGARAFIIVVG